jgi:hypothetical protein
MAGDEDEFDKEISELLEGGSADEPEEERSAEKEAEFLDLLFYCSSTGL